MGEDLVLSSLLGQLLGRRTLPATRAQPVDAEPARQLGDPRADRLVAPQPVQVLVHAREDLLEDVLRVVLREPEGLDADRVDVAREAIHQLVPRGLIPTAAPRDELCVRQGARHRGHQIAFSTRMKAPRLQEMSEWSCASCGSANPEGTRFCGQCGAKAPESAPTEERRLTLSLRQALEERGDYGEVAESAEEFEEEGFEEPDEESEVGEE